MLIMARTRRLRLAGHAWGDPTAGENLHGVLAHWPKAGGLSADENVRANIHDRSEHGTLQ
jgi:hypothetical protein